MDNISNVPSSKNLDKPMPFDSSKTSEPGVSRSPLNLGGGGTTQAPKIEVSKPAVKSTTQQIVSADRITGVKTFFAKLHPGALSFLDEQVTNWLKENPAITIKRTNATTGEIQGKQTEPNIIITIWY